MPQNILFNETKVVLPTNKNHKYVKREFFSSDLHILYKCFKAEVKLAFQFYVGKVFTISVMCT